MSVLPAKQKKSKAQVKKVIKRNAKTPNVITTNKNILDNFYSLVHNQPNVRLTAACSTFKILNVLKKDKTEIFNNNLNYCIERLVAGLASSRAQARRGYGTLLLEILNTFSVSTERLFAVAENKFIGHISKDTTRDNLLGYFLLLSIILESGNYKKSKANSQQLEKVYRFLIQLHNTKSYFEYPISNLLCRYHEPLYQCMLADIPPQAFGSDAKLSSIQLLIILLCNKTEPVRGLSSLDSSDFLNMCSVLQDDRFKRRPLHPVFLELTRFVTQRLPQQFEHVYSQILKPTFFKANHNELAAMGLDFTAAALESIDNVEAIKVLLNEHIIKILILSTKNNTALKVHAVKFFKTLSEQFTAQSTDDLCNKQYTIIHLLTSSISFEQDYMKSLLKEILSKCSSNVLKKHLEAIMRSKTQTVSQSIAEQIAFIIRRPQLLDETETIKAVIKFVVSNFAFSEDNIRPWISHAYHNTMEQAISGSHLSSRIDLLKSAINFCDENTSEPSELWLQYKKSLGKHLKLVEKNNECKKLLPITTLFLFYGLQIFEHQFNCRDQLEELEQCASEISGSGDVEGTWADVLTDQIIALLSSTECKPWIRKLCEKVFRSLVPYISASSIDLLCEAIKAPLDLCTSDEDESMSDEDETGSEDEDEDEDDDDNEGGDEDEHEDIVKNDDEKSEEHHDLDSDDDIKSNKESESRDDDNMSIDDEEATEDQTNLTKDMRSETNEIDDESEEEYLDDEQMMKLDPVIADMFKLNRKKKPDPSFKLRCLDLVKILLQKQTDPTLVDSLLDTLLPLCTSSKKSLETKPISDKILLMLNKMTGKSKYPKLVDFLEKQQIKKRSLKTKKRDSTSNK